MKTNRNLKPVSREKMKSVIGGKFFGWECSSTPTRSGVHYTTTYPDGSVDPASGSPYCIYECKYYAFGVVADNKERVMHCDLPAIS